jgi:translation initiation factor 2 subunit 3
MTTMLSGAAIMDGALLVIAANEKCPQPQTFEHFKALEIIGIKNLIIVQNKVDVVSRERARESYNEIKRLIEGTWAENAPIIPISALKGANIDVLMAAIQKYIPTPERDLTKPPLMHIVRSFDVNKPGTPPEKLAGGVVGGTLSQGELKIGDEIVILPGMKVKKSGGREEYQAIYTEVTSLRFGEIEVEKALPGGLLAVGTKLDPSITKRDQLIGNVLTIPNNKLPIIDHIEMEYHLLERVVGAKEFITARPIQAKERLMITIGTALTKGVVERVSSNVIEISLSKPIVGISGSRAVFSREINGKWRLAGWGILKL